MGPARAAVERALRAIGRRDDVVRAWASVDAEGARARAAALDGADAGPLTGVVLGVKDLFDTAGLPTELGSPVYAGRRPTVDAAAVAGLRLSGAVVLGKTVTAELGGYHPGPTTNPHDPTRTPGGSSMGSAAAVAAGMADLALGAQTAASVVRPASFCGVFGYKATFGAVSRAGLRVMAPSLDTVGWFAPDAATIERARTCLLGDHAGPPPAPVTGARPAPVVGVLRTDRWDDASGDSRRAVEGLAAAAGRAGAAVVDLAMPEEWRDMDPVHTVVMEFEGARSLATDYDEHGPLLSASLRAMVARGRAVAEVEYRRALAAAETARRLVDDAFGPATVVLTPAVVGEAPVGLASTGDPRFGRLWSLLGLPVLCFPAAVGSSGLPVGVQVVGRAGADAEVTAAGMWLEAAVRL